MIVNRVIKSTLLNLSIRHPEELPEERERERGGKKLRKSIDKYSVRSMGLLNGPRSNPSSDTKGKKRVRAT